MRYLIGLAAVALLAWQAFAGKGPVYGWYAGALAIVLVLVFALRKNPARRSR